MATQHRATLTLSASVPSAQEAAAKSEAQVAASSKRIVPVLLLLKALPAGCGGTIFTVSQHQVK